MIELEVGAEDLSSISYLDIPINELSSGRNAGVQLFNVRDAYTKTLHVMFTQMSAHKGIKLSGEKTVSAMFKELKQLNGGVVPGKPVIELIHFDKLTDKNKKELLEAVNLIAQKRCDKIKGRTCANGSRKRKYVSEGESFAGNQTWNS